MSQLDMFGPDLTPARTAPAPYVHPEFAPYPDALIKRLGATLRLAQRAEVLPWSRAQAKCEADRFYACVLRLRPDRRGDLAEQFRAEMMRLGLHDPAA